MKIQKPGKPAMMADAPEPLRHVIEKIGFDADGNFAIIFVRPMFITDIRGEAELSLIGNKIPVGRMYKVFVEPMEQAPTDAKVIKLV